jgi:hypothetical protein
MAKEVAVKTNTALATQADLFKGESTSGFENVHPEDVAIPFLFVLQTLSPQVKKGSTTRIPGAEEGMLFNNVSLEVIIPPVRIVPCAWHKAYVEWVPRENGGGFVAQHTDEDIMLKTTRNDKRIDVLPNGNHIIPTSYHYVIVLSPTGKMERAVISMTRTQLKKSRRWMSQMLGLQMKDSAGNLFRPPMYSHTYDLNTEIESRDQYSWYGYAISNAIPIDSKDLFLTAKQFHSEVVVGKVKVATPVEEQAASTASDEPGIL